MVFVRELFSAPILAPSLMLAMLAACFVVGAGLRPRWGLQWLAAAMALAAVRGLGSAAGLIGADAVWLPAALAAGTLAALFTGLWRYAGRLGLGGWTMFGTIFVFWMTGFGLLRAMGVGPLAGPAVSMLLFTVLVLQCVGPLKPVSGSSHTLVAASLLLNPVLVVGLGVGVLSLPPEPMRAWALTVQAFTGLGVLVATMGRMRMELQTEIDQRREAEAALRQLTAHLEQRVHQRTGELQGLVDGLESFNRMVSHDLRGPLGGMAGLADLARAALQRGDHARVDEMLALMGQESRRLTGLVAQLLTLARVSNAELHVVRTPLDAVLAEALGTLRLTHGEAGVACVKTQPLPEAEVDPTLMTQVFVNLLDNALKFCRGLAQPEVRVLAGQGGDAAVIEVRDNGPGFDPALAGRLFQPFSRLQGTGKEGNGIGLTIVRRIVERHGGRVWAEGRPGQGASFFFSLPMQWDGGRATLTSPAP